MCAASKIIYPTKFMEKHKTQCFWIRRCHTYLSIASEWVQMKKNKTRHNTAYCIVHICPLDYNMDHAAAAWFVKWIHIFILIKLIGWNFLKISKMSSFLLYYVSLLFQMNRKSNLFVTRIKVFFSSFLPLTFIF